MTSKSSDIPDFQQLASDLASCSRDQPQERISQHFQDDLSPYHLNTDSPDKATTSSDDLAQLSAILASNTASLQPGPWICFEFENLPGIRKSCGHWGPYSFDSILQTSFGGLSLLDPYLDEIRAGKLFISSPSVLGGEWIQVHGEGTLLEPTTTTIHGFLRQGDERIIPDLTCDCRYVQDCWVKHPRGSIPKVFLIKVKWRSFSN